MPIEKEDRHESGPELDESSPARVKHRHLTAEALAEQGFGDVLVLSTESAERALTPARRAIVNALAHHDVDSQRELAGLLDRDPGNVKRDLAVLIDEGVVGREQSGRAYRPFLKHDAVVAEPVPVPDAN